MKKFIPLLVAMASFGSSLFAAEDSVGLSAAEAFQTVSENPEQVLFLDVRDPVEIMFTGFTDLVDLNIPFQIVDRDQWNEQTGTFQMDRNPAFIAEVDKALMKKGLKRSATIITMCRSGSARGLPSAAFLRENGFPNATYVIHGFQGDQVKEGPQKGRRVQNGWVNTGLPWSPKANPDKIQRIGAGEAGKWLVILTSDRTPTQAMALILSTAASRQGTEVTILLCDQAGFLAVNDSTEGADAVQPVNASPRDLLQKLLQNGAAVQVCGIFLPSNELTTEDLLPGVTSASPPDISHDMSDPDTKVFVF